MPVSVRARSACLLSIAIVAALVATLFAVTPPADAATRRQQKIGIGLDVVRAQKGDPYQYGASGPGRFDCSGLTYYSYRRAGFRNIPRTSNQQARFMNRIDRRKLRKGDFVFFYDGRARARNVYHMGVFAGWRDGRRTIIHAPYGGKRVHRSQIWSGNWFAGTLRGL